MILADTSVWVEHLRHGNTPLKTLLQDGDIVCHPMIIGELACGDLHPRQEILGLLAALPVVMVAEHAEVLKFIEQKHLAGKGLGYIDAHLLASAVLSDIPIWTEDASLKKAAILFDKFWEHSP